ncbi:hypothetical protein AA23498_3595 [Acetobacter nitrogenifigens DSM 23921 = NBRC 105050]|nr:hypothetical protein AA23498_3595 [Acetobacter nitrogenifigens DSM 23921 = NBRC 105050]
MLAEGDGGYGKRQWRAPSRAQPVSCPVCDALESLKITLSRRHRELQAEDQDPKER